MPRLTYVKAFIGAFAADPHAEAGLPVPVPGGHVPTAVVRRPEYVLQTFGAAESTATISTATEQGCIKGRPFAGTPGDASVDPASPSLHAQLSALDGRFSVCALSADAVVLATDMLGAGALFYHVDGSSRLLFSTHLGLLVRALPRRPSVDDIGVVGVLTGSCSVGGRTLYQGIRRLEAAQCLVARRAGGRIAIDIAVYLDLARALAPADDDGRSRLEQFESLLLDAVTREAGAGEFGLMLSGGKDSRALAQALALSGCRAVPALTFGEWRSADVRGAKRTAMAIGLPHRVLEYRDWTFETFAPTIAGLSAGASGLQTAHQIAGYAAAARRVGRAMVGYLGDALTGAHLPKPGQSILDAVFPFRQLWAPELENVYGSELAALDAEVEERWRARPDLSATQRSLLLDLTIRQATWISSTFDLGDWYLPLCFPFYARRLIRFCFNLPLADLTDQRLYQEWLRHSLERIRRRGLRARSPSWMLYEAAQIAVNRLTRVTGLAPMPPLVDWDARVHRSRPWLRDLAETTPDERLRKVFVAQLATRANVPMLLAAGVSLATR